jgi:hypothetical protein
MKIHALATLIETPTVTLVVWEENGDFYINNVDSFCSPSTRYNWAETDTLIHLFSTIPSSRYNVTFTP